MKRIIFVFFIALMFSSCAFHSGNISSGPVIDCPLKNIVTGESSTIKFFGVGGLDKEALILEAKRDLYNKNQYNKNLKLSNFSVDFKTTYFLIYTSTKATVSADLFECEGQTSENTKSSNSIPLINGLSAEDSIIYKNVILYPGKLVKHTSNGRCLISYKSSDGDVKDRKVNPDCIYKTSSHPDNRSYFGYDVGERAFVEVLILKTNTKVIKPCKIVGLNKEKLLISYMTEEGNERVLSVDKYLVRK